MAVKTRVQKWGNSLAVRIPKSFADEIGIAENSSVQLMIREGELVVIPERENVWDLAALLAEVTDENVHAEWGSPASTGREEW